MCGFAEPVWLLLLLLVPPLMWLWHRRPQPAVRFPGANELSALPPGRGRWARRLGWLLRGLVLTLLIVALAGPRCPDERTRLPAESRAVMLLLDVSGSMAEPVSGGTATRLEAAKEAFRLFVQGGTGPEGEQLPGRGTDLVGFIPFARWPEAACPLTLSHGVLLQKLAAEQPRGVPDSETNISDAVVLGLERLQAAGPRPKVLVLLSDGEHNVLAPASGWMPRQAAQVAAGLGVAIHTIDAAGPGSPGSDTLRQVAEITGGRYFAAADRAGLAAACAAIDRLERPPVASFRYRRWHDGYPWFALAALVFWVAVRGLEMTRWQRLP